MDAQTVEVLHRESLPADPRLSLFEKVLMVTDGSVTELLSLYTAGPIRAVKLAQQLLDSSAALTVADASGAGILVEPLAPPLLHRRIVLVGHRVASPRAEALEARPHGLLAATEAGARLVHAESAFAVDRMSEGARKALLETDTPIGSVWKAERSEMYREIRVMQLLRNAEIAAAFALPPQTLLLSRVYALLQGGAPFGFIRESFPLGRFV